MPPLLPPAGAAAGPAQPAEGAVGLKQGPALPLQGRHPGRAARESSKAACQHRFKTTECALQQEQSGECWQPGWGQQWHASRGSAYVHQYASRATNLIPKHVSQQGGPCTLLHVNRASSKPLQGQADRQAWGLLLGASPLCH